MPEIEDIIADETLDYQQSAPPVQTTAAPAKSMTGTQKAAILLITLGMEASSEVLKLLEPEEVEKIASELVRQKSVDVETKKLVFDEFANLYQTASLVSMGGVEYARSVLDQAIGPQKAEALIERIVTSRVAEPSDWLQHCDPSQLGRWLAGEQPQTIALIISQLPGPRAATALAALDPDLQAKVTLKIARMESASPEVVRQIEDTLRERMAGMQQAKINSGGVSAVVQILNAGDRSLERSILDTLGQEDPGLADEVKRRLFVFEDILQLDDRAIQVVLRDIEQEDLRLALRGSQENVKEKIFKNMSERAASALKEDIEMGGPVRLREVEAAQQRIALNIRSLEERGEIAIARGEEAEQLV